MLNLGWGRTLCRPCGGCVATGVAAPRLGRFSHFTRRLRAGLKPKWPLRGCFAGLSTTCATQEWLRHSLLRDLVLFANLPSAEALGYTLSPHAGLILVCFFPPRQIDTRLRPVSEGSALPEPSPLWNDQAIPAGPL